MISARTSQDAEKPGLLVVELWGLGDLALAVPFLRQSADRYAVSVLAKAHAIPLLKRLCPEVRVMVFEAPWTVFRGKYRWWKWPWKTLRQTLAQVREQEFRLAVSARSDPRDHLFLWLSGVPNRLGFPRLGSGFLLTQPLPIPPEPVHRYERWRALAAALGQRLPPMNGAAGPTTPRSGPVLVHTGAARPVRVWPLERYAELVRTLRRRGYPVRVACDPEQTSEWARLGEPEPAVPTTVDALLDMLESGSVFIGNDSGPGHLAAASGLPTFTIFGPQFAELFLPLHPQRGWVEGKPCPYKPCFDACRYPAPHCILKLETAEVTEAVRQFLAVTAPKLSNGGDWSG